MGKKLTQEQFITKANKVHNNFYDYSEVIYKNMRTPICIICKEHGKFLQKPSSHVNGSRCPKCNSNHAFSQDEFIKKAKEVHGGKYDYSKVIYKNIHEYVEIICPVHGSFRQKCCHHLNGHGCKQCLKLSNKIIIEKGNALFDNFYDYSKVNYIDSKTKIIVICPIHGEFEQWPLAHLNGHGCKKCAGVLRRSNTENFILQAKEIHGELYDYSLVDYKHSKQKVKIICPKHGIFEQAPDAHLVGKGCPSCVFQYSQGENEITIYIKSFYKGIILKRDRTIIKPYELDIYLPDLNLAIEYNGEYWHKKRELEYPGYHKIKAKLCKEKGIKLINISDKSWTKNSDKVKTKIKSLII